MSRSSLSYRLAISLDGSSAISLLPMDHPVTPSMCPSAHQPSTTLKLGTPLSAAFMPLVPEASWGRMGLFNQRSTPEVMTTPAHFVVLDVYGLNNVGERTCSP